MSIAEQNGSVKICSNLWRGKGENVKNWMKKISLLKWGEKKMLKEYLKGEIYNFEEF